MNINNTSSNPSYTAPLVPENREKLVSASIYSESVPTTNPSLEKVDEEMQLLIDLENKFKEAATFEMFHNTDLDLNKTIIAMKKYPQEATEKLFPLFFNFLEDKRGLIHFENLENSLEPLLEKAFIMQKLFIEYISLPANSSPENYGLLLRRYCKFLLIKGNNYVLQKILIDKMEETFSPRPGFLHSFILRSTIQRSAAGIDISQREISRFCSTFLQIACLSDIDLNNVVNHSCYLLNKPNVSCLLCSQICQLPDITLNRLSFNTLKNVITTLKKLENVLLTDIDSRIGLIYLISFTFQKTTIEKAAKSDVINFSHHALNIILNFISSEVRGQRNPTIPRYYRFLAQALHNLLINLPELNSSIFKDSPKNKTQVFTRRQEQIINYLMDLPAGDNKLPLIESFFKITTLCKIKTNNNKVVQKINEFSLQAYQQMPEKFRNIFSIFLWEYSLSHSVKSKLIQITTPITQLFENWLKSQKFSHENNQTYSITRLVDFFKKGILELADNLDPERPYSNFCSLLSCQIVVRLGIMLLNHPDYQGERSEEIIHDLLSLVNKQSEVDLILSTLFLLNISSPQPGFIKAKNYILSYLSSKREPEFTDFYIEEAKNENPNRKIFNIENILSACSPLDKNNQFNVEFLNLIVDKLTTPQAISKTLELYAEFIEHEEVKAHFTKNSIAILEAITKQTFLVDMLRNCSKFYKILLKTNSIPDSSGIGIFFCHLQPLKIDKDFINWLSNSQQLQGLPIYFKMFAKSSELGALITQKLKKTKKNTSLYSKIVKILEEIYADEPPIVRFIKGEHPNFEEWQQNKLKELNTKILKYNQKLVSLNDSSPEIKDFYSQQRDLLQLNLQKQLLDNIQHHHSIFTEQVSTLQSQTPLALNEYWQTLKVNILNNKKVLRETYTQEVEALRKKQKLEEKLKNRLDSTLTALSQEINSFTAENSRGLNLLAERIITSHRHSSLQENPDLMKDFEQTCAKISLSIKKISDLLNQPENQPKSNNFSEIEKPRKENKKLESENKALPQSASRTSPKKEERAPSPPVVEPLLNSIEDCIQSLNGYNSINKRYKAFQSAATKKNLLPLLSAIGFVHTNTSGSHEQYCFKKLNGTTLEGTNTTISSHTKDLDPQCITDCLKCIQIALNYLARD